VQYAMRSLASSGVAIGADIIDEGSMMWGGTPTPKRRIGEPTMLSSVICGGTTCTVNWPSNPVIPGRFYAGTQFAFTGSVNPNLNTPAGQMFTATNITSNSFDFAPAGSVTGTFTASNDPNLEFLWWAGSAGGCPTTPCNPPVPNTALSTIATWLRSPLPHVAISWPALGVAAPAVHSNWAGKDSTVSDYMSHYWDSHQAGRTYAWGSGITERVRWMHDIFYSRQNYVNFAKPQIILDSISSFMYVKRTVGAAFYNPLLDTLEVPGTMPAAALAGMMVASALGNAAVRLYQFEEPVNEGGRASARIGTEFQTGASPLAGEENSRNIWRAVGYASNLLTKTLQPFILGTAMSSPALGANIVTAARQSATGTLLMAVNGNDWDRSIAVDLRPYRTGSTISRYVVGQTGISTVLVPDVASDNVKLKAGEVGIWLLPISSSTNYVTSNPISAPALPDGATAAILHQAYIYSQDLDCQTSGIDCTRGCNLIADTNLGNVFYQFFFTDNRGKVVSKSAVRLLASPPRHGS
jgi:hypothetical protein